MPNRILKESICVSESINQLTWFEEVLFYRLIVNCDDYGRFYANPAIIRGKLFPLKDRITLKEVENALSKLADIGIVRMYLNDNKPYLYLPTWGAHQKTRAKESKFPDPESGESCKQMLAYENTCEHMTADDNKCTHMFPYSNTNTNTKTNANNRAGARGRDFLSLIDEYSDGDEELADALKDFVEMRKAIKKPLTERAMTMIFTKLKKLSEDRKTQIDIINQSVLHNWQDVYELKGDAPKSGNSTFDTSELDKFINNF